MTEDFAALSDQVGREIRLRSTKWTCQLVAASTTALVIAQPAGTPIDTWKEVWTPHFDATIHFWCGKWYNVIQMWKADGMVTATIATSSPGALGRH
jgi:protein associated with RNAse G/E